MYKFSARAFFLFGFFCLAFLLLECSEPDPSFREHENLGGEELARMYCGSCHQFAEPDRLPAEIWKNSVLPRMAIRLGRGANAGKYHSMQEIVDMKKAGLFPGREVLDSVAWEKIVSFYLREAPDSLSVAMDRPAITKNRMDFSQTPVDLGLNGGGLTSLLHWAPTHQLLYIGDGRNQLFRVNKEGEVIDHFNFNSPPVAIYPDSTGGAYVLCIGFIYPNDLPRGRLSYLTPAGKVETLIDGLPRPVDMAFADLDGDGLEDFVLCGYGHFSGRLSWFRQFGERQFEEQVLVNVPGAIKTHIADLDGNGLPDILSLMAQGDEQINVHYNRGQGRFEKKLLLRFDPVFGSAYFEPVDFDADGDLDLLYVNGDNADYSFCRKPYHGIRLFANDGAARFEESWFFPLNGAFKAQCRDFDNDGDLDIAAISFFPDYEGQQPESFVFLENEASKNKPFPAFSAYTFPDASQGRWLVMETGDLNEDGRTDIMLGSFLFSPTPVPGQYKDLWYEEKIHSLILWNKGGEIKAPEE